MSPASPKKKLPRRTSSSPVLPAWKVTPAVVRSTSRKSSRLRSSIRRSVITVTDCGMSRRACVPLPMPVSVARSVALEWVPSAFSLTITLPRVLSGVAGDVCAQPLTEATSISAPRGISALSDEAGFGATVRFTVETGSVLRREFLLRAGRANRCAKGKGSKQRTAL